MALQKSSALAAAIIVLAYAHHAAAAVVVYNETVNGDLPDVGSPLPIMALDVGVNTIKGKSGDSGASFDFDSFAFTVPAGAQLVSGSITAADSPGNSGDLLNLDWVLNVGSPNYASGSFLEYMGTPTPGTYTFTTTPLGPNVYNVSANSAGYTGSPPVFAEYTFSLVVSRTVAAVPEAATLMVWGLILAAAPFGAKVYRKREAAEV